MRLRDLMSDRDVGRFQKLTDSFTASVRASAKRYNKWVTGKSASLIKGTVLLENDSILFNFDFDSKEPQFFQLETGRKQGKQPPVTPIYEWLQNKGFSFANNKERLSTAWAIAKKIEKEGTRQYRMGNKLTGIYTILFEKFKKNVDKYIEQWCNKVVADETIRINKVFQ